MPDKDFFFFGVGEDRCFVSCGRFSRDVVRGSVTALSIEGDSASTGHERKSRRQDCSNQGRQEKTKPTTR